MKKMLRWWLTAAAIFSAAALVGGPWLATQPHLLVPVLENVAKIIQPAFEKKLLLALIFFGKNTSVTAMALFSEQAFNLTERVARAVLARLRVPQKFVRALDWKPWWANRIVPLAVLIINGAVLAGVCGALHKEGMSGKLLAAGLLPHGVPELSALFLACGAGIAGAAPGEKFALFRRVVVTLLAVAAVLETWVTPEVMRFVEF